MWVWWVVVVVMMMMMLVAVRFAPRGVIVCFFCVWDGADVVLVRSS
jgi:hypothetical protein